MGQCTTTCDSLVQRSFMIVILGSCLLIKPIFFIDMSSSRLFWDWEFVEYEEYPNVRQILAQVTFPKHSKNNE